MKLASLLALGAVLVAPQARSAPETIEFGRFEAVTLYRGSSHPRHVVLFVSGDGGWNLGVVGMAEALASLDALVVGVDVTRYLRTLERSSEPCSYPAADFEALSQLVQKKLELPAYRLPILVGYSSGATLVYATLVQAPPSTFRGAISLGFCPELPLSRPLCRGSGLAWEKLPDRKGLRFLPASHLESSWIVVQGTIDQVCDPARTEAYVKQVRGAEIVLLPHVGHGFSVEMNWMPQFRAAFSRLVAKTAPAEEPRTSALSDLPLVELPSSGPATDTLAVIVSGDGGWAGLDREVAGVFSARGVSVVGLDSLQYFWKRKTPDEASHALERILDHYLAEWRCERAILVGYSRGADVLPFMVGRLPERLRSKAALIALLGPGPSVDFEFHLTDWLTNAARPSARPVSPEVEKLRGMRILCVYGRQEKKSLCPTLSEGLAVLDARPGAHHFGGDYAAIADAILAQAVR